MCSAHINFTDLDTGEDLSMNASDLEIEENVIRTSLRENRHYTFNVMASNVLGTQLSLGEISELFLGTACV